MTVFNLRRGDKLNLAEIALAEKTRDANVRRAIRTSEIAIVSRYDAQTGRVDVFRKFDPNSRVIKDVPVLWGNRRWPLKEGDLGVLFHTHDDSTGAFDDRQRGYPDTPDYHAQQSPLFDPREGIVLAEALDARWDAASLATDYDTFGPDDEVIFLEGGSLIITKSTGDVILIPASGRKVRIGDAATQALFPFDGILSGEKAWNPGSVANGASTSTTVTVTGAVAGDVVLVSFTSAGSGWLLMGAVTSTNTVTVTLFNATGSSSDLGSGTLKAVVISG